MVSSLVSRIASRQIRGWPQAPPPVVSLSELPDQPRQPKTKILHIVTQFADGAGRSTLVAAVTMSRDRYEVWVASSPHGTFWEEAERNGVRPVKLSRLKPVIAPVSDLVVLIQLVRLIRRERFTLVHTHASKAGWLGRLAAWICRTPIVIHTLHGFPWHNFMRPWRRATYLALERFVRPMTTEFFAVSPQIAIEAIQARVAHPAAVSVVQDAVDLEDIPQKEDKRVLAELGIRSDSAVVGTVGRVAFQKAPLDFVQMAALVRRSHPETQFVWVGDGDLLEDAHEEARRLGVEVRFTGFRLDAPRIASCFDVYVVSSLYEGLGIALSEAMAAGRAVVATAVNGVVDLVEHGSTGLLAPPGDPDALARNVAWMLDHPEAAHRMGEAARDRAHALFDPSVMSALIESNYSRLLGIPPTTNF
jgi:glycosyltransferase involved in cell wall biosynthesis